MLQHRKIDALDNVTPLLGREREAASHQDRPEDRLVLREHHDSICAVFDRHELVQRGIGESRFPETGHVDMEYLAKQIGGERWTVANQLDYTLVQQRHHSASKLVWRPDTGKFADVNEASIHTWAVRIQPDTPPRRTTDNPLCASQTARQRLLELYAAGSRLPHVEPPDGITPGPTCERPKGWPGFDKFDVYWEVFDPYEESVPVAGLLSDDLLDVYGDLQRGLVLWNKGGATKSRATRVAAIWEWRFHFEAHWGDHAADALRALHRACGRM